MKAQTRPITLQRLDRILHWSTLALMRLAAWIVQIAGIAAPLERAVDKALRPKINIIARGICWVIAVKALMQTKRPKRSHGGKPCKASDQAIRSVIGSHLRKRVHARDLRAKIAAILTLIHDADREIARFVKRLRRGLTRRCGGFACSAVKAVNVSSACSNVTVSLVDTS